MVDGLAGIQQIDPTHHLADGSESKTGHDPSEIFGDKIHQVDHMFGFAGKFAAQFPPAIQIRQDSVK